MYIHPADVYPFSPLLSTGKRLSLPALKRLGFHRGKKGVQAPFPALFLIPPTPHRLAPRKNTAEKKKKKKKINFFFVYTPFTPHRVHCQKISLLHGPLQLFSKNFS
jgi:hypothetical protein